MESSMSEQTMAILSQNFVSQVILLGPSVSARLHTLCVGDVETQMARLAAKTSRGQKKPFWSFRLYLVQCPYPDLDG